MDSPSPRLFKFRVFSSSSSFEFEFGELGGADLAFEFELAALAELELELFSRLRPWRASERAPPPQQRARAGRAQGGRKMVMTRAMRSDDVRVHPRDERRA
jgi:hypothetical protein